MESNRQVKNILKTVRDLLKAGDYRNAISNLCQTVQYEDVDIDLMRDAYELLGKILNESDGSFGIDALPMLMSASWYEDPLIDMNVSIALNAMEQQSLPGSVLFNSRSKILEWIITNTGEFARVNLNQISSELGLDLSLIERVINDAIFDGDIIGEYDALKKELMVLPFEKEKRQLKCIICYKMIPFDDPKLVRCKYCGSAAHEDEILQWAQISKNKCPRCASELELVRGI
ncbi:MAG: RING finger protein [Candidatus Helarchaeota archaeon]